MTILRTIIFFAIIPIDKLLHTFRYILTGITSWGIDCGKEGVPGVYASVQKALCFIDYATKCKHGDKYKDFYDYGEDCNSVEDGNWIDNQIEFMEKRKLRQMLKKVEELQDSCINTGPRLG